jgi:transposase
MPSKKYNVRLSDAERERLETLIQVKTTAYIKTHARILLKADTADPDSGWSDADISFALDIGTATVERLRKRFVEEGIDACLSRKTRVYQRLLNFQQESDLYKAVYSDPPAGKSRWTLRLLSEWLVELGYVENISHESVRQTLRTWNVSLGTGTSELLPQQDEVLTFAMGGILNLYDEPEEPNYRNLPLVYFGETSK